MNNYAKSKEYFGSLKKEIDVVLNKYLPEEIEYPSEIHEVMRYIVFPGGSRWRSILCLTIGEKIFGAEKDRILPVACALELFHNGSLALDDLPCMDDAEIRRGKPACHKKYGEAITILASIALSQIADPLIAKSCFERNLTVERYYQIVQEIKGALGTQGGVIGGQIIDVISTGKKINEDVLKYIHNNKAGALYSCASTVPGILLDADEMELECLRKYGEYLGVTYQICDDILDVVGCPITLGKELGADKKKKKNTFVSFYGLEKAKILAKESKEKCLAALEPLGEKADILRDLVECILWFDWTKRDVQLQYL